MSSYRRRLMLANQTEENLYLYGNSVQDGTPTPDAPIEIMSLEKPTISVDGEKLITIDETTPFGKNLIPNNYSQGNSSCFTWTHNEDGTILISGSGDETTYSTFNLIASNLNDYLIDGETYSFAVNADTNIANSTNVHIYIYAKNKETGVGVWFLGAGGKSVSKLAINKTLYDYVKLYLQIEPTTASFENLVVSPIMALGSYTELPFEPYKPPITTYRGIGGYKDRIYTKDGKVWFEQKIQYYEVTSFLSNSVKEAAFMYQFSEKEYPYCSIDNWPYVYKNEQMSNIGAYSVTYNKTGDLHWYISSKGSYLIPPDTETWTNATTAYDYLMSVTGNVPMKYQYVLKTPIVTEITGSLADKILAIDKTKNITITSSNGVSGNVEVIEE